MHSWKKSYEKKPFRVEDRTSIYLRHRLLFEFPVNLKLFGHVLYNTDDYTYVQSQPIHEISICSWNIEHIGFARLLPENAFKHCIRQQYTTKTSTVTPHFYCNFRPYMTCWIFMPSFITSFNATISIHQTNSAFETPYSTASKTGLNSSYFITLDLKISRDRAAYFKVGGRGG